MDRDAACCAIGDGYDHGEYVSWSDVSIVKARTRKNGALHRCGECDEQIAFGTVHEVYMLKSRDTSGLSTYRTCMVCVEIRDHFRCSNGWVFGEIWNELEESFFSTMKAGGECMHGLSPAAKQFLIDRRRQWLFDAETEIDGAMPPWFVPKTPEIKPARPPIHTLPGFRLGNDDGNTF